MPNKRLATRKVEDEMSLGTVEREVFGATITIREQTSGSLRTLALTGQTSVNAIRSVCGQIDDMSGDWRVLTISTPPTIFRDMRGARITFGATRSGGSTVMPEHGYLQRVGRGDLLDPSVRKSAS